MTMDSIPSLMVLQTMMEMMMVWENAKVQTQTMDWKEVVLHGLEKELGPLQILRQSASNSMTHSMINLLAVAVYRNPLLPHKKHLN